MEEEEGIRTCGSQHSTQASRHARAALTASAAGDSVKVFTGGVSADPSSLQSL